MTTHAYNITIESPPVVRTKLETLFDPRLSRCGGPYIIWTLAAARSSLALHTTGQATLYVLDTYLEKGLSVLSLAFGLPAILSS